MSDIPRGLSGKRRLNVRAAVLGVRCISESHERRYALFGIVAASHMGAGLDIGDKSVLSSRKTDARKRTDDF